MGVSHATPHPHLAAEVSGAGEEVIWHDLECGSYRADLPLWRELAGSHPGEILEIGSGTGRVALDLARAGHEVTALDRDGTLLGALRERASGAAVRTVCADARSFELSEREFALCLVPMQTIQLLGGRPGRTACLRRVRAHLRPGGLLACAILGEVEPFDCRDGHMGPSPESALIGGRLYVSRPTRVGASRHRVEIEREREVLSSGEPGGSQATPRSRPATNVIGLDRVTSKQLGREAIAAGLRPEPSRFLLATEDHVGSTVVMLRG